MPFRFAARLPRRLLALAFLCSAPAQATTYIVNSESDAGCDDDGALTLREVLTAINTEAVCGDAAAGDADNHVTFAAGSAYEIGLGSALPAINRLTYLDGGGAVVLQGQAGIAFGLQLTDHYGSELRGLSLRGFSAGTAISLEYQSAPCGEFWIAGNLIGLADDGVSAAPNRFALQNNGCDHVTIGGTDAIDRNVIAATQYSGVTLSGATANDNLVLGNYFGLGTDGATALPLGTDPATFYPALQITAGASRNVIGGTTAGARNVFAGNDLHVFVQSGFDAHTDDNVIAGNYFGLDASGSESVASGDGAWSAVRLQGDSSMFVRRTIVGGNRSTGGSNYFANHDGAGVELYGNVSDTKIAGNYFGLLADGQTSSPLTGACIELGGTNTTTKIGGDTAAEGNVISSCLTGLLVEAASGMNTVRNNIFGFDASGSALRRNGSDAILAAGNFSFGGSSATRNVFARGSSDGVVNKGASVGMQNDTFGREPDGDVVAGGVDVASVRNESGNNSLYAVDIYGGGAGIAVSGGRIMLQKSKIDSTTGPGIAVTDDGIGFMWASQITPSGSALAIDHGDDGPTENDLGDGDTGPSELINFPVITRAALTESGAEIEGTINTTPNTEVRIEAMATAEPASSTGHGALERTLGLVTVTTDGNGNAAFLVEANYSIAAGEKVTVLTSSLSSWSTSEPALNVEVVDETGAGGGDGGASNEGGSSGEPGEPAAAGAAGAASEGGAPGAAGSASSSAGAPGEGGAPPLMGEGGEPASNEPSGGGSPSQSGAAGSSVDGEDPPNPMNGGSTSSGADGSCAIGKPASGRTWPLLLALALLLMRRRQRRQ
jgi:hypothetical protein